MIKLAHKGEVESLNHLPLEVIKVASEIALKSEVIDAIKEYLEGQRKESKFVESEYLILTNRAGKMDRDAVNKLLNRI